MCMEQSRELPPAFRQVLLDSAFMGMRLQIKRAEGPQTTFLSLPVLICLLEYAVLVSMNCGYPWAGVVGWKPVF